MKFAYVLPVIYAALGGFLWWSYGAQPYELVLWVAVQGLLLLAYLWLIRGGRNGIMMNIHLVTMAVGMILLFYVLIPWRPAQSTDRILIEILVMGVGTFLCAFGVYSLIFLAGRKLWLLLGRSA